MTHRKSGIVRAMKALRKDSLFEEDEQKLFSEMQILRQIDHPSIVKLYELY